MCHASGSSSQQPILIPRPPSGPAFKRGRMPEHCRVSVLCMPPRDHRPWRAASGTASCQWHVLRDAHQNQRPKTKAPVPVPVAKQARSQKPEANDDPTAMECRAHKHQCGAASCGNCNCNWQLLAVVFWHLAIQGTGRGSRHVARQVATPDPRPVSGWTVGGWSPDPGLYIELA
jgi:hypothetical protein